MFCPMAVAVLRGRRNAARSAALLPSTVVREVGLQKLLATRICDLSLRPEGILAECVEQVISELRGKGITFVPQYYLGDEDFWTADRAVSVNIPWYLANATLWRLVNDHLFEYTREEVLMYLRHEAGHALNYAFGLWKRRDWTQTFGDFRRSYRDVYNPNSWSRDYVRYLHRAGMYHYAQKHPDEDWAETFAVWIDPTQHWRRRYRAWQVAVREARVRRPRRGHRARVQGQPREPAPRPACVPYTDIKEDGRRVLRHRRRRRRRSARVPPRSARDLPAPHAAQARGRARDAVALAGCARRTRSRQAAKWPASSSNTQNVLNTDRINQPLDRESRIAARSCVSCSQLQALSDGGAHGRPRQPSQRKARRADRRRDLASSSTAYTV